MKVEIDSILEWLLQGDVSIQYQTHRDLLKSGKETLNQLQSQISENGWGRKFLRKQNSNGSWGRQYYQPKWTSTHYTLLDLKYLGMKPLPSIGNEIDRVLQKFKAGDGGLNPSVTINVSDVCLNGMFINCAAYFGADQDLLKSIIDYIIGEQMRDGGFNCEYRRQNAKHSSFHSTLSVLEGIREYIIQGYTYKLEDLKKIEKEGQEFLLKHRLFKSDKSGKIINKMFLMLSFPARWRFDILKALDYFRSADAEYDERMQDAIDVLVSKQRKEGTWPLQARHTGAVHFDMEEPGQASRWNTLRVLRVLKHFSIEI